MKVSIFVLILFWGFVSCDEFNKIVDPTDDYLINQTISSNSEEKIIESVNDIKVVFPAYSIAGSLEVKINKIIDQPIFNVDGFTIGSNVYKFNLIGNDAIKSPIKIEFNFNKSKLVVGREPETIVKAFLNKSGTWTELKSFIDLDRSKIVVTLSSNIEGKSAKDQSILLSNNEFMIADGYNNRLTPINDIQICDCGWEVDYTQLTKKINNEEKSVHYLNNQGKKTGPYIFYYDDAKTKVMISQCYLNDLEHGIAIAYWDSGKIMAKTNYVNGLKQGYFSSWFSNGKLSSEDYNLDNKKDGLWVFWYEDGKKYKEGHYSVDKQIGSWTFWYENGKVQTKGFYINGVRSKEWKYWYDNGNLKAIENFLDGKLDGYVESYWENGNLESRGNYKYGKQVGIWFWYEKLGVCMRGYDFDKDIEVRCP